MTTYTAIPDPQPAVPQFRLRRPSTWPPMVKTIAKIIMWIGIAILALILGLYLWSKDWSSASADPAKQPATSQDIRDLIGAVHDQTASNKSGFVDIKKEIQNSEGRLMTEIQKIKVEATASVTVPKRRPFSEILAEHRGRRPTGTSPRAAPPRRRPPTKTSI